MTIEILIPTYDDDPAAFAAAPRLAGLAGSTIGIISNGKHGTTPFFDAMAEHLQSAHGVAEVVRLTKPNYSAPAPDELIEQARHWHALVAGIGD